MICLMETYQNIINKDFGFLNLSRSQTSHHQVNVRKFKSNKTRFNYYHITRLQDSMAGGIYDISYLYFLTHSFCIM